MYARICQEKDSYKKLKAGSKTNYLLIVCLLHLLLWTTLYVVGSTLYVTISTSTPSEMGLVPAVTTETTGLMSVIYVALHNLAALLSRPGQIGPKDVARLRTQWLSEVTLRLTMVLWLVSCGLSITFTLARHPKCLPATDFRSTTSDVGTPCIIQCSAIGASLLALIVSLLLFVMVYRSEDPFRAHLLGIAKEQDLLPLMLPYKACGQRSRFSDMSFKCRSSTSLSSHTLVPTFDSSSTTLLPKRPEKVVGLGIYAPKASATFLGPRPSLSSIRTHKTIGTMPPAYPLPLLPAYFPQRYRKGSAMHTAVYPPRRPPVPERSKSERTVRIVPPSPALSMTNLRLHNSSMESLSSVYSRSISGENFSPNRMKRSITLTDGSRSYSSGSTATIIKSPLSYMTLAKQPDGMIINKHSRKSSDGSATEIDDVVTLQAKLPSVKAVSHFGDVETWKCQSDDQSGNGHDTGPYNAESKQRTWMPLRVKKTRGSESLFQCSNVRAIV